jgi:hypothetical protein
MKNLMPFNNQRAPVYARDGMACSSTPLAAVVGRDILKAGGNANQIPFSWLAYFWGGHSFLYTEPKHFADTVNAFLQ